MAATPPRTRVGTGARAARYLGRRLLQALIVIWATYTIVFVAIQLLPSDPVTIYLSNDAAADPALVESLRSFYGYDQPWYVQYVTQLAGLLRFDFGFSISTGQAVLTRIGDVVGSTVALASTALLLSILYALAVTSAAQLLRRNRRAYELVIAAPSLAAAVPVFWLGLIVLIVFSFHLRILPLFPDGSFISLVIPAAVLAIPVSAPLTEVLLSSMRDTAALPFVNTARAKGASPVRVLFRHVLRASLAPAVSVLGTMLGVLIAGSVITETVFLRPGLGNVLLDGVVAQDVPLVQGLVMLTTVVVVISTLLIDLLLPLLDPRVLRAGNRMGVVRLGA